MSIDPTLLSPISALLGALVGDGALLPGAIYTQRSQDGVQRVASEIAKRETVYADFVMSASNLLLNAYTHDEIALSGDELSKPSPRRAASRSADSSRLAHRCLRRAAETAPFLQARVMPLLRMIYPPSAMLRAPCRGGACSYISGKCDNTNYNLRLAMPIKQRLSGRQVPLPTSLRCPKTAQNSAAGRLGQIALNRLISRYFPVERDNFWTPNQVFSLS